MRLRQGKWDYGRENEITEEKKGSGRDDENTTDGLKIRQGNKITAGKMRLRSMDWEYGRDNEITDGKIRIRQGQWEYERENKITADAVG
jgi:hypothetical protein